jgi:hypothetical protein
MRMGVLALYLILAITLSILTVYLIYKRSELVKNPSYCLFIIFTFFLLFSFGGILIATGNSSYGFDRTYPLSLIAFGILATMIFSFNDSVFEMLKIIKFIVLSTIILLMVFFPIITYGSEPYHFFAESENKANEFGINHFEKFNMILYDKNSFSHMMYNYYVLKEQTGFEYSNQFKNKILNKIYSVGKTGEIYQEVGRKSD